MNTNTHIEKIRMHLNNINSRASKESRYDAIDMQDLITSLSATRDALKRAVAVTQQSAA